MMDLIENAGDLSRVFCFFKIPGMPGPETVLDPEVDQLKLKEEIVIKLGQELANLHGSFWCDKETLEKGRNQYMKAAGWFFKEDKASWDRQMDKMKSLYTGVKEAMDDDFKAKYPKVCQVLHHCIEKIDWDAHVAML